MRGVSRAGAPLTLEQVYQMQSDWRAYYPAGTRRPPRARIVLAPLALQACQREGIDPTELMYREIWQFAEPNISEEIQLMRHAAYMQLREEKMECVSRAKEGLLTVRNEREALARAVEAKINPVPDDARSKGSEGLMRWTGRDFSTLDGKPVEVEVARHKSAQSPYPPDFTALSQSKGPDTEIFSVCDVSVGGVREGGGEGGEGGRVPVRIVRNSCSRPLPLVPSPPSLLLLSL